MRHDDGAGVALVQAPALVELCGVQEQLDDGLAVLLVFEMGVVGEGAVAFLCKRGICVVGGFCA